MPAPPFSPLCSLCGGEADSANPLGPPDTKLEARSPPRNHPLGEAPSEMQSEETWKLMGRRSWA